MKLIRVISLSLLMLFYGMPLPAHAQTTTETFSLPDVRAGEAYRINIESLLRDKYRLRLETDARSTLFRWALKSGELPPGLVLRPNGTVTGIPRIARTQPYNFQVKVINVGATSAEALILDLSLNVVAPQIRLVQVNAPKLVPLETDEANGSVPPSNTTLPAGANTNARAHVNYLLEGASNGERREAPAHLTPQINSSSTADAVSDASASMMRPQSLPAPPCDINVMPAPSAASGEDVFYLDARSGNLYQGGRPDNGGKLVPSTRRFKRDKRAVIVVDNKNPYLYTYKLTIQATPVLEPALDAFVPLIVGSLGEFKAKAVDAEPSSSKAVSKTAIEKSESCKAAKDNVKDLILSVDNTVNEMAGVSENIDAERRKSRSLTEAYNSARLPLFTPNQTRASLYLASKNFINVVDSMIGPNGVNRATLDDIATNIERLKRDANKLKSRVEAIRETYPNCLNEIFGAPPEQQLISLWLRQAAKTADELLADAASYEKALNEIRTDLNKVIEGREKVLRVLCDPHAFFSESVVGQFEETNDVDIQLEVTPRQGVTEAQPILTSPFKAKFTFGNAPFFSISGGLVFSPLRKREYVRVQGFQLDAQGNQVLVNGQPNLTTVIGLKESSPTRIIPAVFLNGLLTDRKTGFIDGVHLSLGITAKNDNKGTDVEFLVGPSLSMLERRMFFTFGGYAGKQQKLAGNLFEGFALPSDVSEIPVEKNYRWSFGFALSYRIPVTK